MAATKTFTDLFIRGLKAKAKPYKKSESARKGEGRLLVRVQPNGAKEFFYRYRASGVDKTVGLGRYGNGVTLLEINRKLARLREKQVETGDVKDSLRKDRRELVLAKRRGSFEQVLDAYVDELRANGRLSADEVASLFVRHVKKPFPALLKVKATDITADDITGILARMVGKGIKRQVNVLRAYLHAAFGYAAKSEHDPKAVSREVVQFGLTKNPVSVVARIDDEGIGNRTLKKDEEIRAYWQATEALPTAQRTALRVALALAGQRPKQLLRATFGSLDLDKRELLLRDTKGRRKGRDAGRDHLVPLTDFAMEQLHPLLDGRGNAHPSTPLFSDDGKRGVVLETLSKAVRQISDELAKTHGIETFQLRDIRRTCETALQALGISKDVRAHLLSHGRGSGVQAKHYERHEYLEEKRAALEIWANKLRGIIDPANNTTRVVPLHRKQA